MSATATTTTNEESVMGQVIPRQHPAVVLKSHYKAVRALLAAALIAIAALASAVVILASDNDSATPSAQPAAKTAIQEQQLPAGTRFDGGPDEGTRGISTGAGLPPGARFDGGPDEGSRGPGSYWQQASPRTSYQPTPNEGFKARAGGPSRIIPVGPAGR
jgi:hypothetical protein